MVASARPRTSSHGRLPFAKLRAAGDKDAGAVIKAWNAEASKQQQLTGGKAQALKHVINLMPTDVLHDVVVPAVSELGWEKCPWSDETFSIRRIYPGNVPRSGDGAWKERLTVTNASMRIMFLCQIDKHTKLLQTCVPPKLSKPKVEESAEQAALVHSMIKEVQAIVPVPEDELQEKFVRLWVENDPQVHLEVTSVLATKADDFAPASLTVLKHLMEAHCGPRNMPIYDAMAKLESHKTEIEEQPFVLIMSQLG